MKKCNKCKLKKALLQFNRDSSRKDGFSYICRVCENEKAVAKYKKKQERIGKTVRKRTSKHYHPNRKRLTDIERKYKVSEDDLLVMYKSQNYRCKICDRNIYLKGKKKSESIAVDHNNLTGEVRGLLCLKCNCGIGCFYHDTEILKRAKSYLEKFN